MIESVGRWRTAVCLVLAGATMIAVAASCQSKDSVPGQDSAGADLRTSSIRPDTSVARRRILFVGTSLTEGYGLGEDSAYSFIIQRKIDSAGLPFVTANGGVSGETTAGLLQRLDWILKAKFDVLVIESGANDGLRGVAAKAIRENLIEFVRQVQAARPEARILLVQMEALPNYGRDYGTSFHDTYTSVARETKIGLLPFLLDGVAGRPELNQGDGIHPNIRGERIVAENVWRGLEPVLRKRVAR
jgi:acyl-CoA thioesterase I